MTRGLGWNCWLDMSVPLLLFGVEGCEIWCVFLGFGRCATVGNDRSANERVREDGRRERMEEMVWSNYAKLMGRCFVCAAVA